jgi:hypothetical protein
MLSDFGVTGEEMMTNNERIAKLAQWVDDTMIDHTAEQAAKTEALENACAEWLFQKFDWKNKTAGLIETLNGETPNRLDAAITAFMMMDSLTLRLLLESSAMSDCEASASKLVAIHGDNWLLALENEL